MGVGGGALAEFGAEDHRPAHEGVDHGGEEGVEAWPDGSRRNAGVVADGDRARRGRHRGGQRARVEPVLLARQGFPAGGRDAVDPDERGQEALRGDHGEGQAQGAGPEREVGPDHHAGGEQRLAMAAAERGDGSEPVEFATRHEPGRERGVSGDGSGCFAQERGRRQGRRAAGWEPDDSPALGAGMDWQQPRQGRLQDDIVGGEGVCADVGSGGGAAAASRHRRLALAGGMFTPDDEAVFDEGGVENGDQAPGLPVIGGGGRNDKRAGGARREPGISNLRAAAVVTTAVTLSREGRNRARREILFRDDLPCNKSRSRSRRRTF